MGVKSDLVKCHLACLLRRVIKAVLGDGGNLQFGRRPRAGALVSHLISPAYLYGLLIGFDIATNIAFMRASCRGRKMNATTPAGNSARPRLIRIVGYGNCRWRPGSLTSS